MTSALLEYGTPLQIGPQIAQCQRNSFLREFQSKVVSIQSWAMENSNKRTANKNKSKKSKKSKKKQQKFFELELADTILFPDGGGQPTDTGIINNSINVLQVQRTKDGRILHKIDNATDLTIGSEVSIKVNWERRFDHMQQHSAQHLISAIMRRELNAPTISWWMSQSPKPNLIEIRFNSMTNEQKSNTNNNNILCTDDIMKCEQIVNEIISNAHPMTIHVFYDSPSIDEFASKHSTFKQKELPPGTGPLRVIEIADVEFNTCCGTHLSNTAQLQSVIFTEWKYNAKESLLKLYFVAGNRVLVNFHAMFERERQMFKMLSCGDEELIGNLSKIQHTSKEQRSALRASEKALIGLRIDQYLNRIRKNNERIFYENFVNGSMSMVQQMSDVMIKECDDGSCFIFVLFTVSKSESSNSGQFFMACNDVQFMKKEKKVLIGFIAKGGGGKPGRLQGKAQNLKNCSQVIEFVTEYQQKMSIVVDDEETEQREENAVSSFVVPVVTEETTAVQELDHILSKLVQ